MRTRTKVMQTVVLRVICCAFLIVAAIASTAPLSSHAGKLVPFRASFDTVFQLNSPPPILNVTVQGEGIGLHVGKSSTFTTNQVTNVITGASTANYTVIAANGDTLSFEDDFITLPTSTGVTFEGTYTIIGGIGRFSGATGSGTVTGSADFTGANVGVGQFTFDGTISSPGSK